MNVPGAAHTPRLEPTRAKLEAVLGGLRPQPAHTPFYSTVSGKRHDGDDLGPRHWGAGLCHAVRFAPAIDRLMDDGYRVFVEIGPHPLLTAATTQCGDYRQVATVVLPSLRRDDHDLEAMMGSFGGLYVYGAAVDWQAMYPVPRPAVSLPNYAYQRQRCWIEPAQVHVLDQDSAGEVGARPAAAAPAVTPPASADHEYMVPDQLLQALRDAPAEAGTMYSWSASRLEAYLLAQFARALGNDPAKIDPDQPVTGLGIDSLMAMEIKSRVESELGVEFHMVQLLEGPSIRGLAQIFLPQLDRSEVQPQDTVTSSSGSEPPTDEEAARLLAQIDDLSENEIDGLVSRILAP